MFIWIELDEIWRFEYAMGLKKDVMWVLPKLVEDRKSHKWAKEIVWINDVSKWFHGTISSDYMYKNIKKMSKFDHDVIFEFFGQNNINKGKRQRLIDLKGAFTSINERK